MTSTSLSTFAGLHMQGAFCITQACASKLSGREFGGRLDRWLLLSTLFPSLVMKEKIAALPRDRHLLHFPSRCNQGPWWLVAGCALSLC